MTDDQISNTDFIIVDSDSLLHEMIGSCMSQSCIALDTEFIRTDTFFPKPALIQIFDGRQVYLVDPLKVEDLEPLKHLFLAPSVVKVMHSCSEDLEVFSCLVDCYPSPLVDTQVAANLVGYDFSISYQRLVEKTLGEQLEKSETRSNWLSRPLTSQQLQYAADDVLWLLDAYHVLVEKLQSLDRLSWLHEDCEALVSRHAEVQDINHYYLRVKSAWRLSPPELNRFKSLCAWRETTAREQDKPRRHLLSDNVLLDLARYRPKTVHHLSQIKDVNSAVVRKYGNKILSIILLADNCPEAHYPPALFNTSSLIVKQALKEMKSAVFKVADSLGVQEATIGSRKDLESYLFSQTQSNESLGRGWRGELLSSTLNKIVASYQQS